ncbi:MAG: redoxin domain-containing protein [Planctomycetota bacterium]
MLAGAENRCCLVLFALAAVQIGCGGSDPAAPVDGGTPPGAAEENGADAEAVAMAEELGMTVQELQMKKQMMMDQGMWPDEIAKALAMGGGADSLFRDDVGSNSAAPDNIDQLVFVRSDKDKAFSLKDYIGKKNLVLVFTRGYYGGRVCPFCATQTAQLAAAKDEFTKRDAVVLIIYPGSGEHLPDFVAAVTEVDREQADFAAVGWPVLLDKDLAAVNLLGIAADLARPSSFIVDKQGNVVFAYVGANRTDRPSAKALLSQLDELQLGN